MLSQVHSKFHNHAKCMCEHKDLSVICIMAGVNNETQFKYIHFHKFYWTNWMLKASLCSFFNYTLPLNQAPRWQRTLFLEFAMSGASQSNQTLHCQTYIAFLGVPLVWKKCTIYYILSVLELYVYNNS